MLPTTPPAIGARFNYHETHERAAARPRRRPSMPSPAGAVARIAAGLLEVEAGVRPGRQLEPLCHPTLWEALVRRLPRSGGAAITACSLRRVVIQEHTPGLVEGVALVQRGCRLEPVAMRLDGASGRWQVVVLQYAPAVGAPHRAEADW
jgi:hypothetical protein